MNGELREAAREKTLDIPERSFAFAVRVCALAKALDADGAAGRTLADQLLRSGTSVGANVEEAQAAQSRADFIHKMSIACKEAREANYWLRLLLATSTLPETRLANLIDESSQLVAILTAIVKNSRAS